MTSENDSILARLEKWATEQPGNFEVTPLLILPPSPYRNHYLLLPLLLLDYIQAFFNLTYRFILTPSSYTNRI